MVREDLIGADASADGRPADGRGAWTRFRAASPQLMACLAHCESLEEARDAAYEHLARVERATYDAEEQRHTLELTVVRSCIEVLRRVFAPLSERRTGTSALATLWREARGEGEPSEAPLTRAFVEDLTHLLLGMEGGSRIYGDEALPADLASDGPRGRKAAIRRSAVLDELAGELKNRAARFPSGLEPWLVERRRANRDRLLSALGGREADWLDYRWHLEHVVTDPEQLIELVGVPEALARSIRKAARHRLPMGVTPYYLSLMEPEGGGEHDAAIRAQVLPPPEYVKIVTERRDLDADELDFMGERDTSPIDLITRRYPGICILKPVNTCSQICVYCQRNWEIDECMAEGAGAPDDQVEAAVDWIARHPAIGDVLVTGGDPAVMEDDRLAWVLERVAAVDHVYRIRIGTRTPVVLPFRWTEGLAATIGRFHVPGRREVAVMTHFEHSTEVTPEARDAVTRIRRLGVGVYNQQVFTTFNSRRFETVRLRLELRRIGVDPYYCFNTKGKEETRDYRVPIARIVQERKEEARLLPGLDRTEEPVFNVPRLGKNHLRALQHRSLVALRPDGSRVYELHPWEKAIEAAPTYLYTDVPIQDYLDRLEALGEDVRDYRTIWYYF